jgi:ribosomal protein S7
MRDIKVLEQFKKYTEKKLKEMSIFRHLKKEVETGANGTQKYVIKKGINKGKIAESNRSRSLVCFWRY